MLVNSVKFTPTFRLTVDFAYHTCEVEFTATASRVNSLRSKDQPRHCRTELSKSTWCYLHIAESWDLLEMNVFFILIFFFQVLLDKDLRFSLPQKLSRKGISRIQSRRKEFDEKSKTFPFPRGHMGTVHRGDLPQFRTGMVVCNTVGRI